MVHPVVEKPIKEPIICRDGTIDYTCSNFVNPLVSFDMVREFYDMQAKSLTTVLNEIYGSISKIQSDIEKFQSDVDRTHESYILLQRTVNSQLDNMSNQIQNIEKQTVLQLNGFSDRLDHAEQMINDMRDLINDRQESFDTTVASLNRKMTNLSDEMDEIQAVVDDLKKQIDSLTSVVEDHSEAIKTLNCHTIPSLSEYVQCVDKKHTTAVAKEQTRAEVAEASLAKKIQETESSIKTTADELTKAINDESLRAQNEELKLLEKIKELQNSSDTGAESLREYIKSVERKADTNTASISAEKERATAAENELKKSILDETTRATTAETLLSNTMDNKYNELFMKHKTDMDSVKDMISTEESNRSAEDAEIRNEITTMSIELNKRIEDMVSGSGSELDNKFSKLIADEQAARIAADQSLSETITTQFAITNESINSIQENLKSEIDRATNMDQQLLEKIDALSGNVENLEELEKEVQNLSDICQMLKRRSDEFDLIIDEKFSQLNSILVNKIEDLDNRHDAEIKRVNQLIKNLDHRISALEGTDTTGEDNCDLTEDNPFTDNIIDEDLDNPFLGPDNDLE